MQPGINIEDIRKYNASLREYQDKYNKVNAEIEFNKRELAKLCDEVSAELGISVTPENIEQIYAERVAKIQNTLSIGTEILQRIKSEEAAQAAGVAPTPHPQAAPAPSVTMPQAPTFTAPTQSPQSSGTPVQPGPPPNLTDMMSEGLPPIFANRQ